MLPEGVKDTQAMAEMAAREVWERMRSNRFRVDKRNSDWLDEYRNYYVKDAAVPLEGFPLMSATRYATECILDARPLKGFGSSVKNYPEVKVV